MKIRILSAAMLWACAVNALAVEEIEPVIVSATRSERSAVTTPSSITVIDREAIEASGAQHVVDVLEGQAGIQIVDYYGDGSRAIASMRGTSGDNAAANTLVLVDGRRLNNTDLSAPDLNSIALKDVQRIEIIQGSAGTLFGDQAVGGVINIITRTPHEFAAAAQASAGSDNHRAAHATVSNRLDNGLGVRVSAERRSSDNYRRHNEQEYGNALLRADYGSASGSFFAEYQAVDEELALPGPLTQTEVEADRRQVSPIYAQDFTNTRTDIARLGLRRHLGASWSLEAEAVGRESDAEGKIWGGDFTQQRQHRGLTPRLIGALPAQNGETIITIGADLDWVDYAIRSGFGATDSTQQTHSLYAQVVHPLTERLAVTAGARYATVEYDIDDSFAFPDGQKLDDAVTVAEIGLSWELSAAWRLFARRDGNFRFAKVDENTFTPADVVGLETQTGVSYEMGAEWRQGAHRAKAVAYRLDLDNEIDFDPNAAGGWGANINLPQTRRSGLILEASTQPAHDLRLGLQYSYIVPTIEGGAFDGNTIPFVAEHAARLTADYTFRELWRLFAEAVYTGERVLDGDYTNSLAPLPAITVVNLTLSRRLAAWQFSARINNVTDERYNGYGTASYGVAYYYPAPERNAMVSAAYRF